VLLLCYEFPPVGGGGSKVVAGLAAELLRQGHHVELVTARWPSRDPASLPAGLVLHEIDAPRQRHDRAGAVELLLYVAGAVRRARRLLRERRYDVCNAHFVFPDGLAAWLAGARRVVLTAHGSDVAGYNPERFRRLHRCLGPLWRRVASDADLLIFPSPTLHRLAVRAGAAAPARVIPNGFDPARIRASGAKPAPYVLAVSRLFPRKGIRTLIEAHASLERPVELRIVGDGPQRGELERLAEERGREVRFHGWIDGDDPWLARLYQRAAVFALPSVAENFPMVLLEAMAAGLAIVATRGTGCADVVGDAALLIAPGDRDGLRGALDALIRDPGLRAELGARARARLEREFAWPRVAGAYAQAFGAVAGGAPVDRAARVGGLGRPALRRARRAAGEGGSSRERSA
jgi:glycosyltransferase involved in cell wall biosynthesis